MKTLVIGGSGLVGSNIVTIASESGDDVHATYRSTETDRTASRLDKTDAEETLALVERVQPDAVIDTAAFHAVDDCETDRERAYAVNATGTRNTAVAADCVDAHFVYLSTDYVFPGDPTEAPYREEDPVLPVNYYARAKYAGEQAARIPETATVLRPSVVYGESKPNFVTWALDELRADNGIDIVNDQVSSPTYAPDLARACLEVVERGLVGVYHATGPERCSRYEFTVALAERFGYDPSLVSPITTAELGQEAPRPADSSLDSSALYDALGWTFTPPGEVFSSMSE
jgi:dTDP-4-dehydrorhamnose reductase